MGSDPFLDALRARKTNATPQPSDPFLERLKKYGPSVRPPSAPPDDGVNIFSEAWKGLTSSMTSGNVRMLGAAYEAGEVLADSDAGQGQRIQEFAGRLPSDAPISREEIDGVGDFFSWLSGLTGQGVGSMAGVGVGAGVGAAVGGGIGAAVGSLAPGAGTVAGGMLGAKVGAWLGGISTGMALSVGETFDQLRTEGVDPKVAAKAARVAGPVLGLIDTLGASRVISHTVGKEVKQGIVRKIWTDFRKGYFRGARDEGLTETIQASAREILAAKLTGNPDGKRRVIAALEEGLAGALGGGAIGGAVGTVRGQRNENPRPDLMRGDNLDPLVEDGARVIDDLLNPEADASRREQAATRTQAETDRFASTVNQLADGLGPDGDSQLSELLEAQDALTISALPVEKRSAFLKTLKQRLQETESDQAKQVETDQKNAADDVLYDDEVEALLGTLPDSEKKSQIDSDVRASFGIEGGAQVPRELRNQYMTLLKRRVGRETKALKDETEAAKTESTAPKPETEPAIPETAPDSEIPGADGNESVLRMPSGKDQRVIHRVVEADSLIPSHDPMTFGIDPRYPEGVQERTYHSSPDAQKRIMDDARDLHTDQIINSDPTPTGGPPQTTPFGIVLGGNRRTLAVKRAYLEGTAGGYRSDLIKQAAEYGVDPATVSGMKKPIHVRELIDAPTDAEGMRVLGRDMNADFKRGLSEVEAAVSAGKNLSQTSADRIAGEIEGLGGDVTLRELMEKNPTVFRDVLLADGIVPETDLTKYFTSVGALNDAGKTFIENALVGSFIGDADLLASLPKSLVQKLERIVPAMMELTPRTDAWNIVDDVKEAARLVAEANSKGILVADLLRQSSMFSGPTSPVVEALTRVLARKSTEVGSAFKAYAREARLDVEGQEAMFGKPDPVETFSRIFGYEPVAAEQPAKPAKVKGTPKPTGAPAPAEVTFGKLDKTGRRPIYSILRGDQKIGEIVKAKGGRENPGWYWTVSTEGSITSFKTVNEAKAKAKTLQPPAQPTAPVKETAAEQQTRLAAEMDSDVDQAFADGGDVYSIAGDRPTLPVIEEAERSELPPELLRKSDIVKELSALLSDIPIRIGRLGRSQAHGIYKVHPKVIRLRVANDISPLAHEVGHGINKIFYGGSEGRINWRPLIPFRDELAAIATPGKKGSQLHEGFAEFVRLYITDPKQAEAKAPKYYAEFETELFSHPELRDGLTAVQGMIRRYIEQPAQSKVHGMIRSAAEKLAPKFSLARSWNDFYTGVIDRLNPINEVVKAMAALKGGVLAFEKNAYLMARNMSGWMGKADRFLKFNTVDFDGLTSTGKGLQQIIEPVLRAGRREAFDDYLAAKHAVELQKAGIESGFDLAAAEQTVVELEAEFADTAKELYAFQDRSLDYRVQAGLLAQEDVDRIRASKHNQYYVPFRRIMDEEARQASGTGESMVNLSSGLKRIKGSGREIISPLESIMGETLEMVSLAERNHVGQLLLEQAESTEGSGQYVEPVAPKMRATPFQLSEIKKVLQDRGLFVEGMDSATLNAVAYIYRPDMQPSQGENVITVMVKGRPKQAQVNPDLQRALLPDPKITNAVVKFFGAITRLKRAGATGVNPEFGITNILRDTLAATVLTRNGFIPFLDTARGMFEVLGKGEYYQEWLTAGGAQAALVSMDRAHTKQNIDDMIATPMQWVVAHPIDALRIFGELSENATRLGEYMKARKKGKSKREAAYDSRDLIDFARHGASSTIRAINGMTAFYNASLQGTDKFARRMKEDPKGTSFRAAMSITLPSMILYAINKDDEEYQEQPTWLKDMFWLIPTKGTALYGHTPFLRIPKPHIEGAMFGTVMERAMDFVIGKDPQAFDGLFGTLEKAIVPGQKLGAAVPPLPIPDLLLPAFEWWANKSLFRDGPIVPMSLQRLPGRYQAQPWTSEYAKGLAELAHWAGSDVSAMKIENAVFGLTAGTGRMAAKITDPLLRGADEPERPTKTAADYPMLRVFAVRKASGSGQSIERFYERIGELDKKNNAENYSRMYKRGSLERMSQEDRRAFNRMTSARTRMNKLSQAARAIENRADMSGDEKRDRIEDLQRRRTDEAKRALDAVRAF